MTCLLSQDLSTESFVEVINEVPWPEGSLLLAFTPAEAHLKTFAFNAEFLKATDQGRIFGPFGECRWRLIQGKRRVVYLGEPFSSLHLEDHSYNLENLTAHHDEELILWGVRNDLKDEWLEQQVPQRFRYPLTGPVVSRGRVVLKIEHWRDANGLPHFSRYHSLKEIEDR